MQRDAKIFVIAIVTHSHEWNIQLTVRVQIYIAQFHRNQINQSVYWIICWQNEKILQILLN